MLGKIFLGKLWHWALLVIATALLWFAGSKRFHVIEFNWFILSMLAGTIAVLWCVVRFTTPGEQVTRDRIVASEPEDVQDNIRETE
jgi:predicted permease